MVPRLACIVAAQPVNRLSQSVNVQRVNVPITVQPVNVPVKAHTG